MTLRTFRVEVKNLKLHRSYSAKRRSEETDVFDEITFHGDAVLEKDSVAFIGEEQNKAQEFPLTIRSSGNSQSFKEYLEKEWGQVQAISPSAERFKGADPTIYGFVQRVAKRLTEDPPSAMLFCSPSDWELGMEEGWAIECVLPREALGRFQDDFLARRIGRCVLSLDWVGGLVNDRHAPPVIPVTWGVLKGEDDGGYLCGHVTGFGWEVEQQEVPASVSSVPLPPADETMAVAAPGSEAESPAGNLRLISREVARLARTVKTGFALVLGLMGLLLLFGRWL